jgi:nicotinate-nucleotide--dimethylbenzimidazole phosphoribosyltransferase
MSWQSLLVLGGTGSGASEYADSVLPDPDGVRRVPPGDDLAGLARVLGEAKPDQTLLVAGLADWLPATPEAAAPLVATLATAVRECPARLVMVSPDAGRPAGDRGDPVALGALNRAVAEAADAVVLVVAGQPLWLKGAAARAAVPVTAAPADPAGPALDLSNLTGLPTPDQEASAAAGRQLAALGPVSLGALASLVSFAAGGQRTTPPAPWRRVRVLVLRGDHAGAAAAGAPGSDRLATELREGTAALAQLAAPVGASVQIVEAAPAGAIEDGPASTGPQVEEALEYGWRLAQQAADEGVDLLVLGAIGDGADTAAAAVTAAAAPGTEPAGLLARVRTVDGTIDDQAWIRRCAAVRDAVHRAKSTSRTAGRAVLAELGGADLAIATGLLLGAAARRTPVLLDGPVGAAAGLVARNLAAPARHWWLLPDHGRHPTVMRVGELLGLTPLFDLGLELGEGATALAALPLLNSALTLAGSLPRSPASR